MGRCAGVTPSLPVRSVTAYSTACAQLVRARRQGHPAFALLRSEVLEYYSPATLEHTVSSAHTNREFDALMQAKRKRAWRQAGKAIRQPGSGQVTGGRTLRYQNTPRFAACGFAACCARAPPYLQCPVCPVCA